MLQKEPLWSAVNKAGAQAYTDGHYRLAHKRFRAAAKDATRRDHALQLAVSYHNLALIYKKQRRYRKTLRLLEKALALTVKDAGTNNKFASDLLDKLGEIAAAEDPKKAISCWERAQEIDKNIGGLYQAHMPKRLAKLAYLYMQQGDYAKATSLYQESCDTTLIRYDRELLLGHASEVENNLDMRPAAEPTFDFSPPLEDEDDDDDESSPLCGRSTPEDDLIFEDSDNTQF